MASLVLRPRHRSRWALGIVATCLVVAACGTGGSSTPPAASATSAPSGAPATSASVAPSEASYEKKLSIVTIAPPSISEAPLRAAMDDLRANGYEITENAVNAVDLATAGVIQNNFDLGYGSMVPVLTAAKQQIAAKYVVGRLGNQWQIWANESVQSCQDLDGKKFGISGPSSTSYLMALAYIAKECPEAKPEFVTIQSSQDRTLALTSGQLDATTLESPQAISLANKDNEVAVHEVVKFADIFPELKVTGLIASPDVLANNPLAVRDFIEALLLQFRKSMTDADYLESIMRKYVPDDVNPDDAVFKQIVKSVQGNYEADGGLNEESLQYSMDFFADQGLIDNSLSVGDVGDFTQLDAALDVIGQQ